MDHPGHQLPLHKKHGKNVKEKKKAREQQRYLRKVEKYESVSHPNADVTCSIPTDPKDLAHANPVVNVQIKDGGAKLQDRSDGNIAKKKQNINVEKPKEIDHVSSVEVQPPTGYSPSPSVDTSDAVLEEHHIFRLKKKSLRFTQAMFYCRLCNYHLDSLALCVKHMREQRHSKLEKSKNNMKEIESIEAPSEAHAKALTTLLEATVAEVALKESDLKRRFDIADTLQSILHRTMADVKVNLYGSSLSGFGFHDSDVNLGLEAPEGTLPSQVLVRAFEALTNEDTGFDGVHSEFEERFPCIRFSDKQSGLRCELSTGSLSALKTSKLLADYRQLDPRVCLLAMAFRYWARICGLDRQSDGSLPAYSFVLMTIYFLQHCNPPIVPVLQEKETLECQNTDTLGELWIKMLQFYTVGVAVEEVVISVRKREPVSREELKIPNRRLVIEDPIAINKKNIAKSLGSNTVFQYLIDRLQQALLYFGKPQRAACTCRHNVDSGSEAAQIPHDEMDGSKSIWAITESLKDTVTKNLETRNTGDQTSKLSVQLDSNDQLSTLEQIPIGNRSVSKASLEILKPSGLSRNSQFPPLDDSSKSVSTKLEAKSEGESGLESASSKSNMGSDSDIENSLVTNLTSDVDLLDEHLNTAYVHHCNVQDKQFCSAACGDDVTGQQQERSVVKVDAQTNPNKSEISLCRLHFSYAFSEKILTGGKKVVTVCNGCGNEGHKVADCPDDTLPKLVSLPPMAKAFLKRIDDLCRFVEDQFGLKDWAVRQRDFAVASYEKIIRKHGYSDATLELFGSSRNGFGFANSDMDICLKLGRNQTAEEIDIPNIIEDLAKMLKRHSKMQHIIPISTAKVPIVKFVDPYMKVDVDISLYNCLAQANTRMLYVYSKIDPRVRQLVYTAKVFAKMCDIGDASKGSLSSYAYTIMTIFFLQQRKPPVLPVLQELYDGAEKPESLVEGWNAWFYSDLKKLKHIWRSSNKESVGELWLGFLRFFTEEFSNKKHVVCIRQHKLLSRFEKMWTGSAHGFAIEDPFDLDHNLGSGVSRKMATFIMQVFIKTREHFGTPRRIVGYRNDFEYFFDTFVLTGGEAPPNDRCCRVCGKVGHFLKDCPHRKGHKESGRSRERDEDAKKGRDRDVDRNKAKRDQAANDVISAAHVKAEVPKGSSTQGSVPQKVVEIALAPVSTNRGEREASQDATVMKSTVKQGTPGTPAPSTIVLNSQQHQQQQLYQQQQQLCQQQQQKEQHQQQQIQNYQQHQYLHQYQYYPQQGASSHSSQPNQTSQVKEEQKFNSSSGQTFSFASLNSLAGCVHSSPNLSPNEKPQTLQEVEEAQMRKLKLQHQAQMQPNLTMSGLENVHTMDQISSLHQNHAKFLSTVANSPSPPERMQRSNVSLHVHTSTPEMNPAPVTYVVSPEPIWGYNTPEGGIGPVHTSQPYPGAFEGGSPGYLTSRRSEENHIGTALLQGVNMLQNRESGRRQDASLQPVSGCVVSPHLTRPHDGDCSHF